MRIDLVGTTADFRGFGPPPSLPINHLLCENPQTAGRIGEDGLNPHRPTPPPAQTPPAVSSPEAFRTPALEHVALSVTGRRPKTLNRRSRSSFVADETRYRLLERSLPVRPAPRLRVDDGRHGADDKGVVAVEEIADHIGEGLQPFGRDRVAGAIGEDPLPRLHMADAKPVRRDENPRGTRRPLPPSLCFRCRGCVGALSCRTVRAPPSARRDVPSRGSGMTDRRRRSR